MDSETIKQVSDKLFEALESRTTMEPLTSTYPDITIEDAYTISLLLLERRLARGEIVVGKKIGVTSEAVMDMLDVRQPDFGFITDAMRYDTEMPVSSHLIQPRAEGELAFILKRDLVGPGVTNADVIAATDAVLPCFEVVDSRIENWRIKIQDTVADNASCGFFALNEAAAIQPSKIALPDCRMIVTKNGEVISQGLGAAAMGDPVNCIAWLANTLGEYGITLRSGDIILSGSLVPLEPVHAGDVMTVSVDGMGDCSVSFV
ncbi:MAG: fumarylacetoacetate hydrolase family protein [Luminiphilus sp.]|jgi:2-oxopent-4-enoate/cis-2-oxohex-4-enoate hydratase|nr:fumarylacetoacetate hydrolase family protein [Luminiphilus sp.]